MNLENIVDNEYLFAVLLIFLVSYSVLFRPTLPNWVSELFKNDIFRVIFIAFIAMIPAKQSPHVAIILAIIFVTTLHFIQQDDVKEKMSITEHFVTTSQHTNSLIANE